MTPDELHALDCARAYLSARRAQQGADPAGTLDAQRAVDGAYHDLLVALDEPCGCDPGTCPRYLCRVCDDGLTLEQDATCAGCGRHGSCAACAEGDCARHPRTLGDGRPWDADRPTRTIRAPLLEQGDR